MLLNSSELEKTQFLQFIILIVSNPLRLNFIHLNKCKFRRNLYPLNPSLKLFSGDNLLNILFYGTEEFTSSKNEEILKCAINFL